MIKVKVKSPIAETEYVTYKAIALDIMSIV